MKEKNWTYCLQGFVPSRYINTRETFKKMFMKQFFTGIRMLAGKNIGTVLATVTRCSQEP